MIRNAFLAFAMNASNFVKHISNVTVVFFFSCVTTEMTAKGQSGTRSHSNMSFLQCAANGLVAPLQPYEDFRETFKSFLTLRGKTHKTWQEPQKLYLDRALKSIL